MHVHLIGVCGTGMGTLAGLLRRRGHHVTGSDVAFYPPMGDALTRWGVETQTGYRTENLEPRPDFVVIGNVCRKDNPEARAAIDGGMAYDSMAGTLETMFLYERPGYVVVGTHGKTTTTALLAFLLYEHGIDPSFFVGGIPRDFDEGFRLGAPGKPFVIEGDEYDSAFFEKRPKFLRYNPRAVILTSIEHDHIDIYPDDESYTQAFIDLVIRIPPEGVLVAWAGSEKVREVAGHARCRVVFYALDEDNAGDVTPVWLAARAAATPSAEPFDLFIGGMSCGRVFAPLSGAHNVRNALAALALAAEAAGVPVSKAKDTLARFRGVRRRQELLATVHGIDVYEDFAHHPTAVMETLRGLRRRHPKSRLLAAFEPRSATASRRLHAEDYPTSLAEADMIFLAPVGRPEIAEDERLDTRGIAAALRNCGRKAQAFESVEALRASLAEAARPGDVIVLMSNGSFGGIYDPLLAELTVRALPEQGSRE